MVRSSALGAATRVEPVAEDQEKVAQISRAVAEVTEATLRFPGGEEIALPASLVAVLLASAGQLSAGRGVTILATEVLLTPAEAGELLGLSRPFVVRLLDEGRIPAEFLPNSRHRVIRLADLLEFQAVRERRKQGRRKIAEVFEESDLPY